jgi:hypothetical protein
VKANRTGDKVRFELATKGLEYVDVFVEQRPRDSRNVVNDALKFDLPEENAGFTLPADAVNVELRGYAKGQLVACRRLSA